MAEYLDVMEQFHRMCAGGKCPKAIRCPMYPARNISQCRRIAFEKPAEFENRVMDWAKAHPEPQYPTWAEWLEKEGIIYTVPASPGMEWRFCGDRVMTILSKGEKPIPADIAEKLGIEPNHFAGADKKEG